MIIAKKGFQKGAHGECKGSNVSIHSWDEFTTMFTDRWLRYVIDRNARLGQKLKQFGNYLIYKGKSVLGDFYLEREEAFLSYREKYSNMVFLSFRSNYTKLLTDEISVMEVERAIEGLRRDINNDYKSSSESLNKLSKYLLQNHEIIFSPEL